MPEVTPAASAAVPPAAASKSARSDRSVARGVAALALLLGAGCTTLPEPVLGPPPGGPPAPPLRVAITQDYAVTSPDLAEEAFLPPFRPALDVAGLQTRIAGTLRERGGFERVETAPDAATPLLLEVVVEDARVRLEGRNWVHPLKVINLIVSSLVLVPTFDPLNWILPGEDYVLESRVRWKLVGAGQQVLGRGVLRPAFSDSFAPFGLGGIAGRPWFYLGFLRVPECLDPGDWAVISAQLEGPATQVISDEVVAAAEGARPQR